MAQAVVIHFDEQAEAEIRALWGRVADAGVPPPDRFAPHLTLAVAGSIPPSVRKALRTDLSRISLPSVWLAALSTFASSENVLMLAAVADAELLAVHSAVHDVLAGQVRNPSAYYLPGSWMPHCTLAQGVSDDDLVTAFGAVFPAPSIRATVREMAVVDTTTATVDPLVTPGD